MNLLTLGTLDREASHPAHDLDPLGRFYDVGTQLSISVYPWCLIGVCARRYSVAFYFGPLVMLYYSRKPTTGIRAKASGRLDRHV